MPKGSGNCTFQICRAEQSRGSDLKHYFKKKHNYWSTQDTRGILVKGAKLEHLTSLLEGTKLCGRD